MRAGTSSRLERLSVNAMLESYVDWREESSVVGAAYQLWVDADAREGELAYTGYLAALDREEHAARGYADQVKRVAKICR
jgi:hypothetical protein